MNRTICNRFSPSRDDLCLQTLFLLFKCANHRNKRPFVTVNEALVGILITIGDVNVIFAIPNPQTGHFRKLDSFLFSHFVSPSMLVIKHQASSRLLSHIPLF